MLDR
jgi:hypothetical protein